MSSGVSSAFEAFVAEARRAHPDLVIEKYKVRSYGNSKAMADIIVPLILQGEKTGTFAQASEFETDPAAAPAVGDLYVVTQWDGTPALLYRIIEVERVPFEGINHQHVQVEGPNARDVATWRKIHWDYWGGVLRAKGREPSMQMPVIFSRFELLHPRR